VTRWMSGCGMVSTVSDFARFGPMLLNGGSLEARPILSLNVKALATYHIGSASKQLKSLCEICSSKRVIRKMRGYIMMLMGAVFASNLLTFADEARGQVVNIGDRFRSGGEYIGVGGRSDKRGSSLRYRSASQSAYGHYSPRCYFPEEWPKLPPWPPFCN
jgi:CubicO group peptidase (beta-lactamase class C family)